MMFTLGQIESEQLQKAYSKENIKVKKYGNSNRCYIFFSSHALYYPNTQEVFQKVIMEDDRYEWEHLAESPELVAISGMHIFVRDVYKQWYVDGINNQLNTLDKVMDYLQEITKDYEIIIVGNSAGGYMAAIAAWKLNAVTCYNFAGQISLLDRIEKNELLKNAEEDITKNKYFNIVNLFCDTNCKFYYFYAKKNLEDCSSYKLIADNENVKGFGFRQKVHGVTMFTDNMIPIICYQEEKMDKLACIYNNKTINRWEFLIRTISIKRVFYIGVKYLKKTCFCLGWQNK